MDNRTACGRQRGFHRPPDRQEQSLQHRRIVTARRRGPAAAVHPPGVTRPQFTVQCGQHLTARTLAPERLLPALEHRQLHPRPHPRDGRAQFVRRIGQELTLLRQGAIETVEQRIEPQSQPPDLVARIVHRQPGAAGGGNTRGRVGHGAHRTQCATGEPPSGPSGAQQQQRNAHQKPAIDLLLQSEHVGETRRHLHIESRRQLRIEWEPHGAHRQTTQCFRTAGQRAFSSSTIAPSGRRTRIARSSKTSSCVTCTIVPSMVRNRAVRCGRTVASGPPRRSPIR